jgi:hypothetical protein
MKSRGKYHQESTLAEFIETVTIASTKRRAETLTFSKQKTANIICIKEQNGAGEQVLKVGRSRSCDAVKNLGNCASCKWGKLPIPFLAFT